MIKKTTDLLGKTVLLRSFMPINYEITGGGSIT